ncbi:MAG: redoxin domain-containing protein [Nitrososphaerales archaeon]
MKRRRRSRVKRKKLTLVMVVIATIAIAGVIGVYYFEHQALNLTKAPSGTQIGDRLPDLSIMLLDGSSTSLSSYYNSNNHSILLWFVATWSPYSQQGLQSLASSYYSQFNSKGVTILVIEFYDNFGQQGPSLSQFANQYGGGADKQGWLYGTMNQNVTATFDPYGEADPYYMLNSNGIILTFGLGNPAFSFLLTKA